MSENQSNLPKNEDPRPKTGSIVQGSSSVQIPPELQSFVNRVMSATSPVPDNEPTSPPPMPSLKAPAGSNKSSSSTPNFDFDDIVHATAERVMKRMTVGGQPGVVENGRVDFPITQTSDDKQLGPTASKPIPEHPTEKPASSKTSNSTTPPSEQHSSTRFNGPEGSYQSEADKHNSNRLASYDFHGSPNKDFQARQAEEKKQEAERAASLDPSRPLESTRGVGGGDPQKAIRELGSTQRLQGESGKDYEDRRAAAREISSISDPEKKAEALNRYAEKAMNNVHLSNLQPGSYIPLCLTRADGRTKSLVYVQSASTIEATHGVSRDVADYFDGYTHPFKVVLKRNPRSTEIKAGVIYYSHLFKDLSATDTQSITGLLSYASDSSDAADPQGDVDKPPSPPSSPDPSGNVNTPTPPSIASNGINGWISVNNDDYIWLEVTISSGNVTKAEIKSGAEVGSVVENDGQTPSNQTYARKVLAKIVDDFAEQYVTTNLVMQDMCINGESALYPVPY